MHDFRHHQVFDCQLRAECLTNARRSQVKTRSPCGDRTRFTELRTQRISQYTNGPWCQRRDSNPHFTVSQTAASSAGLLWHIVPTEGVEPSPVPGLSRLPLPLGYVGIFVVSSGIEPITLLCQRSDLPFV